MARSIEQIERDLANNPLGARGSGRTAQLREFSIVRPTDDPRLKDLIARSALLNELNQARRAQGQPGDKRVEDARNEMYALARGRPQELSNDPMDRMVSEALTNRVSGNDQPYNEETRNALMADRTQQAAAAEQALLSRFTSSGGGRASDPAYQAMQMEAQAARQAAVQNGSLEIAQRANLENYDARTGAIGQAVGFNGGRQDRQTDAQRYLGGLLQRETSIQNTQPPAVNPGVPQYSQFIGQQPRSQPIGVGTPYTGTQPPGTTYAIPPRQPTSGGGVSPTRTGGTQTPGSAAVAGAAYGGSAGQPATGGALTNFMNTAQNIVTGGIARGNQPADEIYKTQRRKPGSY